MKLVIVSHTAHYRNGGEIVGWGATVREVDQLARDFDQVRHVAFLHPGPAPASSLPYRSPNVRLVPVPASGGEGLQSKLAVLGRLPTYARAVLRELAGADVVHVRCPASISLVALLLLSVTRRPTSRWVKYAGSWSAYEGEPRSYAIQRWWLRHGLARALVTVNGRWPDQPPHVRTFLNPCLTDAELFDARRRASGKTLTAPVRLLFVGRLEEAKGASRALQVVARLRERGIPARLVMAGGGPDPERYRRLARELQIEEQVEFHGWLPRPELDPVYAAAHIMILPSRTEGWPKVLSEGMAFGVVPVAGAVGSIPFHLGEMDVGRALGSADVDGFAAAVADYASRPECWRAESLRARRAARLFTFSRYRKAVLDLVGRGA